MTSHFVPQLSRTSQWGDYHDGTGTFSNNGHPQMTSTPSDSAYSPVSQTFTPPPNGYTSSDEGDFTGGLTPDFLESLRVPSFRVVRMLFFTINHFALRSLFRAVSAQNLVQVP